LKEEALDCTRRRTRFGRGYGPVVRRTAEWVMNVQLESAWCICSIRITCLHMCSWLAHRLLYFTLPYFTSRLRLLTHVY